MHEIIGSSNNNNNNNKNKRITAHITQQEMDELWQQNHQQPETNGGVQLQHQRRIQEISSNSENGYVKAVEILLNINCQVHRISR